ncbi:glycosyltransferase [Caloramator sp. mosi_1]|nr:glycosyltransferase [Caloramator sp. mosi_1]WDC85907.1 glycosyltransferase [Caloramator sp. mosi_1]
MNELGLENDVVLTGMRSDISELMQMSDILLLPSFYEGIPVTLIESQAVGLKAIVSDNISKEVCITDDVISISINNEFEWIDKIIKNMIYDRKNNHKKLQEMGYDIKNV